MSNIGYARVSTADQDNGLETQKGITGRSMCN